ncbi:MAG: TetR/AcrR family transcriptional regulator [Ethanoligenens sp.]
MDAQNRKDEILRAAGDCFARYGYEKTTLDDIGNLVGLNKASLYHYYKNKENIYTEVIYQEACTYLHGVMIAVKGASGCKAKVLMYLTQRLAFIKNALNLKQLSIDSMQKIAPVFQLMYDRLMEEETQTLAHILQESIENGEVRACDTYRVAKSILTVAEAIRSRIDCTLSEEGSYATILDEVRYTVSLILDGIIMAEK